MESDSSNLAGCSTFEQLEIPTSERVCFCCLTQNVSMINPFTCSHKKFIEIYLNTEFNNKMLYICRICHSMLRKIEEFREQVHKSYNMLIAANFQLIPTHNWKLINNLNKVTITSIEVLNEGLIKAEDPIPDIAESPKEYIECQSNDEDKKIDIKIKVEYASDSSDPPPPAKKLKKPTPKRKIKKLNSKKAPKLDSINKIYEGKIELVVLNKDDLEKEREMEKNKESYTKLRYKCEDCIKGFDFELPWKTHMEKYHLQDTKLNSLVCDICKTVFTTKKSYGMHYKRHFKRYVCVVCKKRSSDLPSLGYHYNIAHAKDRPIQFQYQCTECDFTTDSNRKYRYHKQKHKEPVICEICNKTFVSVSSYNLHMNNIHRSDNTQIYKCDLCPRTYTRKGSLYMHKQSQHNLSNGGYCDMCDQNFISAYSYKMHMKMAAAHVTPEVYQFVCKDCGKKFKWRTELNEHVDYEHLKNYKYKCKECDKIFQSNKSLIRHTQVVHKKIKPPKDKICDFCGKGFSTLRILRTHVRRHTGERPLQCPFCEATFAHDAALYNHKRLVHKVGKKKDMM